MKDITRLFDVLIASFLLLLTLPLLAIIALLVKLTSRGPALFRQVRVGQWNKDFIIYKFRTMQVNAHQLGALTISHNDSRITSIGFFLRKYKLDELPQLFNVLTGSMSIVGPRPELRKYVNFYSDEQKKVLSVRPGITDYASIEYKNENELLSNAVNPEQYYIDYILPQKIELNNKYIRNKTPLTYFRILIRTLLSLI